MLSSSFSCGVGSPLTMCWNNFWKIDLIYIHLCFHKKFLPIFDIISQVWKPHQLLWVSRVLKYPKKCLEDLTMFFMSTWWGNSEPMEEIELSLWLFEGRLKQGKNVLPDGLNWQVTQKAMVRIQFHSYF